MPRLFTLLRAAEQPAASGWNGSEAVRAMVPALALVVIWRDLKSGNPAASDAKSYILVLVGSRPGPKP